MKYNKQKQHTKKNSTKTTKNNNVAAESMHHRKYKRNPHSFTHLYDGQFLSFRVFSFAIYFRYNFVFLMNSLICAHVLLTARSRLLARALALCHPPNQTKRNVHF